MITIERDERAAKQARANFERAGVANSIELILDDAEAVVPQLDAFDFIFLDVDKRLYPPLLPECVRLLREKVSSQPGIPYSPSSTSTQSGMISS
ncbi:MAG: hypothetical protein GX460_01225, partial [Firmicutes bacterium]|nr:hypothetical protein [Bacillota bacterium]